MPDYVTPRFLWFLVVVVAGTMGGVMAANRGRCVACWSLLCALFPPLLIAIYFMKPHS